MLLFLYNCNINHHILPIFSSSTLEMRLTFSDTDLHSPKMDEVVKEVQSKNTSIQVNGTRWNPTEEQIQILEELYKGGMRTPNSKQINEITKELGTYGRIEGKNVFYWFQNHKARERQRLKRSAAFLTLNSTTPDPLFSLFSGDKLGDVFLNFVHCSQEKESKKRKCREWEDGRYETLNLFPLHPDNDKRNY